MQSAKRILLGALLATVVATAITFGTNTAQGEVVPKPKEKAEPKKKLTVMERKLKYSQQVLTGLALKDFDIIDDSSKELMTCLKDATWRINDTKEYLLHSNEFLRQIESLQKAAKKKNIDAATVAYVEMTFTCVKCHEHLRETRMGAAPHATDKAIASVSK